MITSPISLAARVLHVGRYGGNAEDQRLWPLFLGYPELVRGYDPNSFDASECTPTFVDSCPELTRLTGSRILVVNGEVRAPVAGLFTGNLDYGPIPTELFAFFDAGRAWSASLPDGSASWVRSTGVGAVSVKCE